MFQKIKFLSGWSGLLQNDLRMAPDKTPMLCPSQPENCEIYCKRTPHGKSALQKINQHHRNLIRRPWLVAQFVVLRSTHTPEPKWDILRDMRLPKPKSTFQEMAFWLLWISNLRQLFVVHYRKRDIRRPHKTRIWYGAMDTIELSSGQAITKKVSQLKWHQ